MEVNEVAVESAAEATDDVLHRTARELAEASVEQQETKTSAPDIDNDNTPRHQHQQSEQPVQQVFPPDSTSQRRRSHVSQQETLHIAEIDLDSNSLPAAPPGVTTRRKSIQRQPLRLHTQDVYVISFDPLAERMFRLQEAQTHRRSQSTQMAPKTKQNDSVAGTSFCLALPNP